MKKNLFDVFDYYDPKENGETKISTKSINTKNIMSLVQEKSGVEFDMRKHKKIQMTNLTKVIAGVTAAAVLAVGGTTIVASAASGGIDNFFQSLFDNNVPENTEALEPYVTTPLATFNSTNEDVQWELLGMYGDDNCAMLSFSVTIANGEDLPEYLQSAYTYSYVNSDGTVYGGTSGWGDTVELKKSADNSNVYYANLPLQQETLYGQTLSFIFHNMYTQKQVNAIQHEYLSSDTELQKEYCINELGITEDEWNSLEAAGELPDNFDVDAWKAYRAEHVTTEDEKAWKRGESILSGIWSTEITLDFISEDPISSEYDSGTVTLRSMSATIEYPTAWNYYEVNETDTNSLDISRYTAVDFILTLKDDRKICTDYCSDDQEYLKEFIQNVDSCKNDTTNIYIPISNLYNTTESASDDPNGTERITICYNEPISPEEIAEVRAVHLVFDENDSLGGYSVESEEVIYTAE